MADGNVTPTGSHAATLEWRTFAAIANSIGTDLAGTDMSGNRPYARAIAENVIAALDDAGLKVVEREQKPHRLKSGGDWDETGDFRG